MDITPLIDHIKTLKYNDINDIKYHLHSMDSINTMSTPTAILFTSSFTQNPIMCDEIQRICNGVIFDISQGNWKPIAVPPRNLSTHFSKAEIENMISDPEYDMYNAHNGTLITLYFHADTWNIATTSHINVENIAWNKKTYGELTRECLKDINIEQLNPLLSYTFVIMHPENHPTIDKPRFEFIQSFNRETLAIEKKLTIGDVIYQQQPIDKKDITPLTIFERVKSSLVSWKKFHSDPFYGYILRSRVPQKRDILISSDLYLYIQNNFYDYRINKMILKEGYNRFDYCITRAIVTRNEDFTSVFPNLEKRHDLLKKNLGLFSSILYDRLISPPSSTDEKNDPHIQASLNFLAQNDKKILIIKIPDKNKAIQTITEILMYPPNIKYYMKWLTEKSNKEDEV
jgi:hypothetical protein